MLIFSFLSLQQIQQQQQIQQHNQDVQMANNNGNTPRPPSPHAPVNFEWEIPLLELSFGPRIGRGGYGEVYRGMWGGTEVNFSKRGEKRECGD